MTSLRRAIELYTAVQQIAERNREMERHRIITALEAQHAKNMRNPRFWYEDRLKESDKRICVLASNLRLQARLERA